MGLTTLTTLPSEVQLRIVRHVTAVEDFIQLKRSCKDLCAIVSDHALVLLPVVMERQHLRLQEQVNYAGLDLYTALQWHAAWFLHTSISHGASQAIVEWLSSQSFAKCYQSANPATPTSEEDLSMLEWLTHPGKDGARSRIQEYFPLNSKAWMPTMDEDEALCTLMAIEEQPIWPAGTTFDPAGRAELSSAGESDDLEYIDEHPNLMTELGLPLLTWNTDLDYMLPAGKVSEAAKLDRPLCPFLKARILEMVKILPDW
ncbi:hypothetical protein LTS12_000844 [Elasticomyces elasticus]|nr:hypothetical protein LTS12_000844 [Elasticomyces elasticus]